MAQPPDPGDKPPSFCMFCFNSSFSRWVVKHLQYPDGLPWSMAATHSRGVSPLAAVFIPGTPLSCGTKKKTLLPFKEEHQYPRDSDDHQRWMQSEPCVSTSPNPSISALHWYFLILYIFLICSLDTV